MARLVTSGFETGFSNLSSASASDPDGIGESGSTNPQSSVTRSGGFAMRCNAVASVVRNQWSFTAPALGSSVYGRTYPNFQNGLPSSEVFVAGFGANGVRIPSGTISMLAWATVDSSGIVRLRVSGGTVVATSASGLISAASWPRIELSILINTASTDAVDCRVNGTSIGSATGLSITDTMTDNWVTGIQDFAASASATADCYFDDIAVNDSTGAAQNSWPGDGKVVLLLPASDNAKGTGWTNDAATTTNLFDAVNNQPAAGIADTTAGSGLHQIRNATSNANVNYDANLSTYSAKGVGSTDTINLVVPIVSTGAPVVTSAKAGTYGIVSNPAISNVSLGAGGTAGAFWSGVAAGNFPTGWKWSYGTTTYAPSVTTTAAPVARITQVTASTRIAIVDAMGLYVDYTPAVAVNPPNTKTVVLQAVNRVASW